MTKERFDTIIIGGGMVGMTLGLLLDRQGVRVAVVEREAFATLTNKQNDSRVSAIALGSKHLLERAGVWQHIANDAEPITDIRVTDGHTPVFLHYDHKEVSTDPFGYIVENVITRRGLELAVKASGLQMFASEQMKRFHVESGYVEVELASGEILRANVLVAADGRKSRIREELNIPLITKDYNQTAIVCTIGHTLPHHGLAQERFLAKGPFAVLPMTNNRSSLVWVEPESRAPLFLKLSKTEIEQEILERTGDYLGEISLLDTLSLFPLSLSFVHEYVRPRVALVGDAAHGIHPIAGQGVNLGFRDAEVLAEVIISQKHLGLDIGDITALENYQRARRADNLVMIAATDGINALFSNNVLPLKITRDLGLLAVSKMPAIKRFFMKRAMGV